MMLWKLRAAALRMSSTAPSVGAATSGSLYPQTMDESNMSTGVPDDDWSCRFSSTVMPAGWWAVSHESASLPMKAGTSPAM